MCRDPEERVPGWEDRERLLPRGDPGAELRKKHESTLQRKERKGVPHRGNCRPEGTEVGPWIHGEEDLDVEPKSGRGIPLRRL